MRFLIALSVALFVMAATGAALPAVSLWDPAGDDAADAGSSYVEFSDISDWDDPPPTRAPLVPEEGAPGGYTGPGEEAVPPGWKSWTQDEHNQCGSLKLIFGNQDLNRELSSEENLVHAQGSFFIQFQAIGEGAQDITRFSFSFGKSHEEINNNEILNCNESLPDNPLGKGTAGVYIPFYRSDFDSEDGFFIPIETRNVPDGDYAAAVHAYTGEFPNYVEVARAWALAEVINCDGTGETYCNDEEFDDDPNVIANDETMPWPWVLPGDGQQSNDVNGLTIEILEPVKQISAALNGAPIELDNWTPPPRDRDLLPMNDPGGDLEGCNGLPESPLCRHVGYSHGWKWEGGIEIGDIIQIEAVDRNGNEVFKSIFWDGIGGVIDVEFPDIDFNLLSQPSQTILAGESQRYEMRIENTGGSEAHADFWLALDGGDADAFIEEEHIQAEWMDMSFDHGHPTHLHMEPGQVVEIYVDVFTNEQTPNGTYQIEAALTYPALGEEQERKANLEVTVDGVIEPQENETEEEPELEDSPLPGAVAITALLFAAVAYVGRRRKNH